MPKARIEYSAPELTSRLHNLADRARLSEYVRKVVPETEERVREAIRKRFEAAISRQDIVAWPLLYTAELKLALETMPPLVRVGPTGVDLIASINLERDLGDDEDLAYVYHLGALLKETDSTGKKRRVKPEDLPVSEDKLYIEDAEIRHKFLVAMLKGETWYYKSGEKDRAVEADAFFEHFLKTQAQYIGLWKGQNRAPWWKLLENGTPMIEGEAISLDIYREVTKIISAETRKAHAIFFDEAGVRNPEADVYNYYEEVGFDFIIKQVEQTGYGGWRVRANTGRFAPLPPSMRKGG